MVATSAVCSLFAVIAYTAGALWRMRLNYDGYVQYSSVQYDTLFDTKFSEVVGLLVNPRRNCSLEIEDERKWLGRLLQMTVAETSCAEFRCCSRHDQVSTFRRTETGYLYLTSSTRPEVHSVLHCRQAKTEPRAQLTCTENVPVGGEVTNSQTFVNFAGPKIEQRATK